MLTTRWAQYNKIYPGWVQVQQLHQLVHRVPYHTDTIIMLSTWICCTHTFVQTLSRRHTARRVSDTLLKGTATFYCFVLGLNSIYPSSAWGVNAVTLPPTLYVVYLTQSHCHIIQHIWGVTWSCVPLKTELKTLLVLLVVRVHYFWNLLVQNYCPRRKEKIDSMCYALWLTHL